MTAGRQRTSGLRFADPCTQSLCHALILFRLLPQGFRSGDLRRHLADLSARTITQGAVTYQLRRLRLHGMIERLPNSFRYRITERGLRAALFFTRLYNRLLRPGIAAALPGHFAIDSPLRRAFDNVQTQLSLAANQAQFSS